MEERDYYLNQEIENDVAPIRYIDPRPSAQEITTPLIRKGRNRPFVGDVYQGISPKYENRLPGVEQLQAEELTAQEAAADVQTIGEKLGNAVLNNVTLMGTTFATNTLGFVWGAIDALANQEFNRIYNNKVNQTLQKIQEGVEEAAPIYQEKDFANKSLLQQLGSSTFWAEFIKNAGFSEGAVLSGLASGGLFSSLGAGKVATSIASSILGSIGEASVEAIQTQQNKQKLQDAQTIDKYNKYFNTTLPIARPSLEKELVQTLENNKLDADEAGNIVFGLNMGLLTLTNFLEWGKLFSRGAKPSRRQIVAEANKGISSTIAEDGLPRITKESEGLFLSRKIGSTLYKAATEGFEEGSQDVIQRIPDYTKNTNRFLESPFSDENREIANNALQAFVSAFSDTMQDPQTKTDIAMGFLTGLIGTPTLRSPKTKDGRLQLPFELKGALAEARQDIKDYNRKAKIIEQINSQLEEDEKFKNYYKGLVRHLSIEKDANTLLRDNNIFEYKNAKEAQLISDIIMYDSVGQIDLLKNMIADINRYSDEEINEIINTTSKDGEGPFMQNGNSMPIEDVRRILQDRASEVSDKIDAYLEDKDNILYLKGEDFDNESLENILYAKAQLRNLGSRKNDILDSLYDNYINYIKQYNSNISIYSESNQPKEIEIPSKEIFKLNSLDNKFKNNYLNIVKKLDTTDKLEEITQQFNDFDKINDAIANFTKLSNEYFDTPNKAKEVIEKVKTKVQKNIENKKVNNLKNKLDTANTVSEVNNVVEDSNLDTKYKNKALDTSNNPIVKEAITIKDKVAEVKRYIGYLPNISNEEINNIFDLLDKWANQAQSLSELSVDSDFFRDINNFQETPNEPMAIKKVKFENARKILAQAFKGTTQEVGNAGTIVNAPIETLTSPTDYTSGPIVAVINESGKISDGSTTMPPVNPTTVIPKKEIVEDGNITTVIDDEENTHIIENQADEEVALEEDNSKAAHKILDNTQNPIERQSTEAKEIYNRPAVGKYTLESMRIGPNGEAPKWSTSGHPEWERVHNYLEGKGAYEYIDSGKLAKYKGEVYYGVDPTFDDKLVLMFVKNPDGTYQVIGSNFMSKSKTDQFIGLTQLNEDVLNEYSSREKSDELFISSRTATVQSVREGRIKYSDETRPVIEALLSTDGLQIPDIDILVATTSGLTGNIEDIRALSNLYKKIGMAYLAVPNCKGTKSLIPIIPTTFSADMLEADNYLAKKMKNAIMNLANALGTKDRGNLGNRIKDVLKYLNARDLDISLNADGDIVRLNARVRDDKGKVKQKKGKDGNLYDATTPIAMISLTAEDTSVANIYNQIVAALEATNTKIRINKNLLEDRQYKDSIIKDGYATTHAVNLKPEASWFTLKNNPVSSNKEKPKVTPITIQEASNLWDNRHNYTADKEAKPSVFQQMLEKIMHLGPSYSLTEGERLTDSEELINLATSNPELSISKDILNKKITTPAQQTPQSVGINPADLFSGLMGTGMKFSTVSSIDRVPSKTTVRDIQRKAMRQLRRILPQLSNTESLRVVNYLLTDEGKLANGLIDLQRGIITLSKTGAEGTVYHEAYHYVSNLLLSPQEKIEIFNEAKEIYGDLSEDILEEKLADGFRDYMLTRDSSSIKDRIKNWFRKLYNIVTNWSKTPKNIAGLYQAIAEGKYKNVDKVAEISTNVYYSINSPYLFNPYDIDDRAEYAKELKFYYNFGKFKSISSRNIEAELQRLKAEHPHMEFRVSKNGRITESLGKDIVGTTQIYPIKPKLMPIAKAEAWLKDLEEFTEDSIKKEITIQERNAIQEEFEELGYPSELLDTMTYEELQQLKECHGF